MELELGEQERFMSDKLSDIVVVVVVVVAAAGLQN